MATTTTKTTSDVDFLFFCFGKSREEKSSEKKARPYEVAEPGVSQKIKGVLGAVEIPLPRIQIFKLMRFSELKPIVGTSNVVIDSEYRFSELRSLVEKVASMENGTLTIVVKNGTLCNAEIESLSRLGGKYVTFDFTNTVSR